jgi:hypothetical protein
LKAEGSDNLRMFLEGFAQQFNAPGIDRIVIMKVQDEIPADCTVLKVDISSLA